MEGTGNKEPTASETVRPKRVQLNEPFSPFEAKDFPKDIPSVAKTFSIGEIGTAEVRYGRPVQFPDGLSDLAPGVTVAFPARGTTLKIGSYPLFLEMGFAWNQGQRGNIPNALVEFPDSGMRFIATPNEPSEEEDRAIYSFRFESGPDCEIYLPDEPHSLADLKVTFVKEETRHGA